MSYTDVAGGLVTENIFFLNTLTEEESLIVGSRLFHSEKESGSKLELKLSFLDAICFTTGGFGIK